MTTTRRLLATLTATALSLLLLPPPAAAQGPGGGMQAVRAVSQMLQGSGDDSLRAFAAEHLAPSYRESMSEAELLAHLRSLREGTRGAMGDLDVEAGPEGIVMHLAGEKEATVRVALDGGKIAGLELGGEETGAAADRRGADRLRVRALEGLASAVDDDALRAFAAEHLTPECRGERSEKELLELLAGIRRVAATAGVINVTADPEGMRIQFRGSFNGDVVYELEDEPPYRIRRLTLDTDVPSRQEERGPAEPVEWDEVAARLEAAEKQGFSGNVLLVRDGELVLHEGYGHADRDAGRATAVDTIYGIGSMPIDFTRAAVLLLAQQGKLRLSDPIGRFIDDVPADRKSMTLEHLISGRSGLPNFHHRPGEDADYDLTWIDRETAIERMMAQPLLFAPGEGEAHSHSAFALLAAIVEIASGESYGGFLRKHFFAPAGMTRTGFYGEDLGHDAKEFAVGYGHQVVSDPNIPPNWGRTSWLAMGSGGMFSTTGDWHRFFTTLRKGEILKGKYLERYLTRGTGSGASDRGFYFFHAWDGDDTMAIFASNVGVQHDATRELGRSLMRLVGAD